MKKHCLYFWVFFCGGLMRLGWLSCFLGVSCASALAFMGGMGPERLSEPNQCLRCHGNSIAPRTFHRTPPNLKRSFSMNWKMFEFASEERPPLSKVSGPSIPGQTYYDWDSQSMTEIYPEKCIDIFPDGRDFPCQFTSRREKTYLIRSKPQDAGQVDSCCAWSHSDFWAPRPDVLQNMVFDRDLDLEGVKADWWILDIPLPGPFGYGTFSSSATPAAFWFPVISGWVQQTFSEFSQVIPDPKYFQLPDICNGNIPVCEGS